MCLFSPHNLIRDAPFSRLDLISCRNLLIYFDESLQNRVIPIFHFALRTGGYLFLGSSENVSQHGKLFAKVDGKFRIFKARPANGARPVLDLPLHTASYRAVAAHTNIPSLVRAEDSISHRASRAMEAHGPAFVVLDEDHDVIHFSGRTGKYLQPSAGAASLNLFAILETSLRPEVRAVLHKAAHTGKRVVQKNVALPGGVAGQTINIIAEPLPENDGERRYTLLIFQDAVAARPLSPSKENTEKAETITYLENELQATRERLQASIEELEASNEELKASNEEAQSVNEELQSANEELESSKEELQSVNEELETVNAELNSKIEGLERANNDRKNLLESTQIATLFLDNELRIRGFTPAITDIFHVIDADQGRPITNIATRLSGEQLERDMRRVMRTLGPVEEEVALSDGSAIYLMRILPYRTTAGFIGGLVITFVDITARKRNEEDLARLAAIVESSRDAVIGMSNNGTIQTWNQGAERIYGYSAAEAVGRSLSLVIPADRPDELRALLERAKRPRIGQPIETQRETKDGKRIHVSSTVSPVRDAKGKIIAISAIERDVTERKQAEEHQALLLAELNHRVKNTLTTVLSLSTRTLRNSASLADFQETFEGRIRALAKTHDILAANNWAGAELESIVITALAPYRERGERMVVSGDKIMLKASAALILAIMLHELATNAVKHGALSTERGRVEVSWETELRAGTISIRWQERDGPKVTAPSRRKGFGLTLIERGMTHELRGNAAFDFRSAGLRCALEMPLVEVTASTDHSSEKTD
jgi:two-component system CheB/CheR fusion protein